MNSLEYCANLIPEMGNGGKKICKYLQDEAAKVEPGNSIIDLAPFLGSTTAWLSMGLISSKNFKSIIHSVDKWELTKKYFCWIRKKNLNIPDLQTEYNKNMKPFIDIGVQILSYKTDIRNFMYAGAPIQILVDDLGIDKGLTDYELKMFQPFFIPGLTIIFFMDFYFFEKVNTPNRNYQCDLMNNNKNVFKFIEHPKNSRTAIYKYLGGKINFIEGEKYYYDWSTII